MSTAVTATETDRLRSVSRTRLLASRPEFGAFIGAVVVFLIFAVLSILRGDVGKGFLSIQGAASFLEVSAYVGIIGIGAFNGWLRVKTRLPSFIVTLAMLLILRGAGIGITRALTGNTIVSGVTQ